MQKGFSLLELSIVLVIIGLIAGGVVAGSAMIRAAELRAVITEYDKFQIAINTFRDKYFGLPGDLRNATDFWGIAAGTLGNDATCQAAGTSDGSTCDGDGNGMIDNGANEMFRFWQHLGNAELLEGSYTGVAGTIGSYDHDAGENAAASKLSGGVWSMRSLSTITAQPAGARYNGYYPDHFQIGLSNQSTGFPDDALLQLDEVWGIDVKVDDGIPGTGRIISNSGCSVANDPDTRTSPYNLTAEMTCAMHMFRDKVFR